MSWFLALLGDELRTQLRRPSPWVFGGLYASLGLLLMIAAGGAFEGVQVGVGGSNNHVDSPFFIAVSAIVMSLFATMNVAAISGSAACRDIEEGMSPLVYSTPVPKALFLASRWLASLLVVCIVVAGVPIGLLVGAKLPFLESERLGAWSLWNGVAPYVGWILPNLVFQSSLFFGTAALTRRMFPNYIGGVLLLVGYLGSQALVRDLDNELLAAMIDPFGLGAFGHQTRYWSPHERNTLLPWPTGWSLANRGMWAAVGLTWLLVAARMARLDHEGWTLPLLRRRRPPAEALEVHPASVVVPAATLRFDGPARLSQLVALTDRSFRDVLGHRYFWAFVAASVLFQLLNTEVIGSMYGTDTWPVTYQVLEVLEGTLQLFVLVVLTFYAGDLVWHERDHGSAPLLDSLPLPDALPLIAKSLALFAVVVGLHLTVPVVGMATQLASGWTDLQPGLYAESLSLAAISWIPFVALTLAIHVLVNQKVLGHLLLVLLWVGISFRGALGFDYHLFWFGADPGRSYSDMNGFGTQLLPFFLFQSLWTTWGLLLLVLGRLFWVRGSGGTLRGRVSEALRRFGRGERVAVAVGALGVAGLSGAIVWATAVARPYQSRVDQVRERVRYERTYKAEWEAAAHPKVEGVELTVDLYPRTGRVVSAGTLTTRNRTPDAITRVLIGLPTAPSLATLAFDRPATVVELDAPLGLFVVTPAEPLPPGEVLAITFRIDTPDPGFDNGGQNTTIVGNGSFVHSNALVPALGYDPTTELSQKAERRKYDLPERPRMRDLDDPVGRLTNYVEDDGDRVAFRAVVSTDDDQLPLAPGRKVEEHTEGGRRIATFEAEEPILDFFSFLSGRWEVRAGAAGAVAIEVYYHPDHPFNVDRMIDATRDSVTSFGERFGPFQYGQIRIVEFPRYESYAQSFPSTIPFSEAIGFIARVVDPAEDIDYPYYITAHEVAHQWWAHQVIAGNTQGATVLSETLAQYSALTQMRAAFGPDHVHRFLRYEQDRYFQGRSLEREKEVPLLRVENQGYIHYQKGGVVLYALAQAVGQDRLDAAIRSFLGEWKNQGPPYPTARDFLEHLRRELPEADALLTDTFERIVLYQNRTVAATARANGDGTWTVTLKLALGKTVADPLGEETELGFDDEVELGVFSGTEAHRTVLVQERRRLTGPEATVELVVSEEPTLAGVDPDHLLLDRRRDDNVVGVELED